MRLSVRHSIHIRELSLLVKLGCSAEERARPQEIRVSAELRFHEAPQGVASDELSGTICYGKICEAFRRHVEGKEFHLIEKLAGDFRKIMEQIVEGRAATMVCVHKVAPPIQGLLGGVEFRVEPLA